MIFFSSTFTDTHRQRDILQKEILPALRTEAHPEGIEITFVDMRYGVRDENTIDHHTWTACSREIERCRHSSEGIFFISLQAEKYGYTPLPRCIEKHALDNRLKDLSENKRNPIWQSIITSLQKCKESKKVDQDCLLDIEFAEKNIVKYVLSWYVLDENSSPHVYVLRNLKTIDDLCYWEVALPVLLEILKGVCFEVCGGERFFVGQSVTEWEVRSALVLNPEKDLPRIAWFRHNFAGSIRETITQIFGISTTLCLTIQNFKDSLI